LAQLLHQGGPLMVGLVFVSGFRNKHGNLQ
jgi:hypothetical protein